MQVETMFTPTQLNELEAIAKREGINLRVLFSVYPFLVLKEGRAVHEADLREALLHVREWEYENGFKENVKNKITGSSTNDVLSVGEVAKVLGVTPKTVRKYIHEGVIKAVKVNKHWKIQKELFREYLDSLNRLGKE